MTKVIIRESKEIYDDKFSESKALKFLYFNPFGRLILKFLINPFVSKIGGFFINTRISKLWINNFVKKNKINIDDYENKKYKSFNDFFTRKIKYNKRPFEKDPKAFISPADSKLSIYNINKDLTLKIKNSLYTLNDILQEDISEFKNGLCLVFRLSVDDYHRYCYVDDGTFIKEKNIKGKLHTVCPISDNYPIYHQNHRIVTFLKTNNFDNIYYVEVGALMVGKIVNHQKETFKKGEEKGYFKMGGSTIVILLKDSVINLDKDIIKNSKNGLETKVKYGERIGYKK